MSNGQTAWIVALATGAASCLTGVSSAAEVKIKGPTEIRPGEAYEYSLMARNDDIPGQQTTAIDWRITGSAEIQFSMPFKPVSLDFFSDVNWVPYVTDDVFYLPPVASARYTASPSEWAENKPWSNVAHYPVQLVPGYSGPFPATATLYLPNDDLIFSLPDWAKDPNVTNLTPTFSITVLPMLGDVNGDGVKDMNDVQTFVNVLLGSETNPDYIAWSDLNGDGQANGMDAQPFVEAMIQ